MLYRKLTGDDDYVFGNGLLDFYKDTPEAVGQSIKTRLLLWLGEWFLNIDEGTPYMQGVIGKKEKVTADATIQQRILSTDGVINIETYSSSIASNNRIMLIEATVNTDFGVTSVQVSNLENY